MKLEEEMMFHLTVGIEKWQREKDAIPDELKKGHLQLIGLCIETKQPFPKTIIPELVAFLKKPLHQWGIPSITSHFDGDLSMINEFGELSDYFQEWLEMVGSIENERQKSMKKILEYCTKHALCNEYTIIRRFLTEHPIIDSISLEAFKLNLHHELAAFVENCYEKLKPFHEISICPYCGWTLERKKGQLTCTNLCRELADFINIQTIELGSQTYYRLKKGIQRFVLLPGIVEIQWFDHLKKRYKDAEISLYPKVDEFDILIKKGDISFHVDVKDYTHPQLLADYFAKRNIKKYLENKNVIIVVPDYRERLKPGYIKQFYARLNDLGLEIPFQVKLQRDSLKLMDRVLMM